MLGGIPDDRLQSELQQPTGMIPQYLVLSEIVRRDKMRSSGAQAPQTTVVQDVMNQAQQMQSGGLRDLITGAPQQQMDPQQQDQQPQDDGSQMYADGGFISPADSMSRAGFAGYPSAPAKPQTMFNSQPQQNVGMFTPNTNPSPAPQNNITLAGNTPTQDNGVQNSASMPSYMQQQNEYANGGIIGLAQGGQARDLAFFIKREADGLGIDPVDLATSISYETAGTFNPAKKGPKTKWGRHIGLIQMGEPQRKQYGYDPEGSLDSQMAAVGRYLKDNGVKPGMGLLDVYSTINAGAPGLYNRSDTKAGGAPGTVLDKVRDQMTGHKEKAMNLLSSLWQQGEDLALGAPVGMAGRETTAGLGRGAGASAIGNTGTPVAGGTVRQGGIRGLFTQEAPDASTPKGRFSSGLRDMGQAMMQQQAPVAPAGGMKSADLSGLDRLRTNPEEDLAAYAQLRNKYIASYAGGGAIHMANGTPLGVNQNPGYTPGEYNYLFQPGGFFGPWIKSDTPAATDAAPDAATQSGIDPSQYSPPGSNDPATAAGMYDVDPRLKARIDAERGPQGGAAMTPSEAQASAEKSQPSAYQVLSSSQEKQQKMLQDYYDSLINLEKDRMSQSSDFGAFLRDLGRGMLTNTNALGPSINAGFANAIGNREDTASAARQKMQELELAKKKAEMEGIGALDKLRYENMVGDRLSARERAQYGIGPWQKELEALRQREGDDSPNVIAMEKALYAMMRSVGMDIPEPRSASGSVDTTDPGVFSAIRGIIFGKN